jgi:hypothetical protein
MDDFMKMMDSMGLSAAQQLRLVSELLENSPPFSAYS